MRASWRGEIIAESPEVLEVAGYIYFPRASVRMELLAPSPKTPADHECPHGVQFFDVTKDGESAQRVAWSYEAPKPSYREIDHWIGFWKDIALTE